jgi:Phosphodiester glycosidase
MKKTSLFIIMFVLLLCTWCSRKFSTEKTFEEIPIQYLSTHFFPQGRTATQTLAELKDCKAVVNGSYFWYTDQTKSTYIPVGVWNENEFTWASFDDPNLQILVSATGWYIYAHQSTNQQDCKNPERCFSAGPMMIEKGIVNPAIKENISHRTGNYPRTVLVISSKRTSLNVLSQQIIRNYGDDILFAVNLDGGPSTSFIYGEMAYNTETVLPVWLCLR